MAFWLAGPSAWDVVRGSQAPQTSLFPISSPRHGTARFPEPHGTPPTSSSGHFPVSSQLLACKTTWHAGCWVQGAIWAPGATPGASRGAADRGHQHAVTQEIPSPRPHLCPRRTHTRTGHSPRTHERQVVMLPGPGVPLCFWTLGSGSQPPAQGYPGCFGTKQGPPQGVVALKSPCLLGLLSEG